MKKYFASFLVIFSLIIFTIPTFAHSGRTDSSGGHHDNINGGYHYHHGYPAHDHPDGECPYLNKEKESVAKENNQLGFLGALFASVFIGGWFGGAMLFAILFFPLSLFFKTFLEEHSGMIQVICSILAAIATFICIYILN